MLRGSAGDDDLQTGCRSRFRRIELSPAPVPSPSFLQSFYRAALTAVLKGDSSRWGQQLNQAHTSIPSPHERDDPTIRTASNLSRSLHAVKAGWSARWSRSSSPEEPSSHSTQRRYPSKGLTETARVGGGPPMGQSSGSGSTWSGDAPLVHCCQASASSSCRSDNHSRTDSRSSESISPSMTSPSEGRTSACQSPVSDWTAMSGCSRSARRNRTISWNREISTREDVTATIAPDRSRRRETMRTPAGPALKWGT